MKECPKCGYQDPPYWRAAFTDVEKDVIKFEDLLFIDKELAVKLVKGKDVIFGSNAYRLTKTGKWVQRMYLPIYKARGKSFRWTKQIDGGKSRSAGHPLKRSLEEAGMIPDGNMRLDE